MKSTIKQEKQYPQQTSTLRKILFVVLCAVIVVSAFTGCNKTVISVATPTQQNNSNPQNTSSAQLNIGYSKNDSLNPYSISTDINSELISLVFEPLFNVDDSFCPKANLALTSVLNGNSLTVKLDATAAFADGVQFSSADVVYSFNKAKESAKYKNELSQITNATATGADSVVFTLKNQNDNAAASLTFPIVKTGTAEAKEAMPIGTGLYFYSVDGENVVLGYNIYSRKPRPNITKINLVAINAGATLLHTLELGSIDAYFDDFSSGSYSSVNAQTAKTNLTNLVFLGMNGNSYGLNSPAVRKAVFYAINRQSIVKNSFKNYAVAGAVPYHPEWYVITDAQYDISQFNLDYSKAADLLKSAGVQGGVNYSLIVYAGNNFKVAAAKQIQENLKSININVTIKELSWDDYNIALRNNAYDLYLGEIKLPANMDMTALFGSDSPIYGALAADSTGAAYTEFLNGKITLEEFTNTFVNNMPFAPICFRMGALIYSDAITPAADCDMGNAYKNIYEWKK